MNGAHGAIAAIIIGLDARLAGPNGQADGATGCGARLCCKAGANHDHGDTGADCGLATRLSDVRERRPLRLAVEPAPTTSVAPEASPAGALIKVAHKSNVEVIRAVLVASVVAVQPATASAYVLAIRD